MVLADSRAIQIDLVDAACGDVEPGLSDSFLAGVEFGAEHRHCITAWIAYDKRSVRTATHLIAAIHYRYRIGVREKAFVRSTGQSFFEEDMRRCTQVGNDDVRK